MFREAGLLHHSIGPDLTQELTLVGNLAPAPYEYQSTSNAFEVRATRCRWRKSSRFTESTSYSPNR